MLRRARVGRVPGKFESNAPTDDGRPWREGPPRPPLSGRCPHGRRFASPRGLPLGRDCVVTIDLASRLNLKPSVEEHLSALGLLSKVCIFYEHTTYNWRLRAFLRMDPRPAFDLCFIDGAHTWETDALAFLLSVQLLQGGGFIIFDDLNYSFDKSPWWQQRRSAELATLPIDERSTSHVREILELLVKPHPEIAEAWEGAPWAYAQKYGTRTSGIDRTMWRELMGQAARVKEHARKTTD